MARGDNVDDTVPVAEAPIGQEAAYFGNAASEPGALDVRSGPTLGVVAIAFNEERDIGGFLRNLASWIDEIIIVDDGSSDRTEEIVRGSGPRAKFMRMPRGPGEYYSHQRNKGVAAASSDWLLHMDIDERVPPDLAKEILEAIRDPNRDGYRFRRLNYFMHRPMLGGGWQEWNLVHLARRERLRFGGMFHEDVLVDAPEARIGQLSHRMIHLNEDGFAKRLTKSAAYLTEITSRIEKGGRKITWLDIVCRPSLEFVRKYFLKAGFRDGTPGLISAIHAATAVFRANALVWDRQNRIPREALDAEVEAAWGDPDRAGS